MTRRLALPLLLAPLCAWSQSTPADQEWTTFIDWMRGRTPGEFSGVSAIFAGYQKKLIAGGMAPAEAETVAKRLRERSGTSSEWMAINFNRLYSAPAKSGRAADQPNAFLAEVVSVLKPGKALDLGSGEGRNTLFLAQKGWKVTALDVSDVGIAHTKELAAKRDVEIDARVQDIDTFDFGNAQWDLICLLYFVLHDGQRPLYQRIANGLRPGGLVIAEGFGNPTMETLLAAWDHWKPTKLKLLRMEYRSGASDWGGDDFGRLLMQRS